MFFYIILIILFICFIDILHKWRISKMLSKIKGPPNLPIVGSVWAIHNSNPDELLNVATGIHVKYGRSCKVQVFHIPVLFTSDLNFVQEILGHSTEIKKNSMYDLLSNWLGEGLLMSYGNKWLTRRRILTPAFHFNILEDFISIFDRQAQILVNKLEKHANNGKGLDVHHYVALATLDVICEAAMGVRIDAQTNEESEYVKLLTEMTWFISKRFASLPYRNDFMFKILAPKQAKRQQFVQNALHNFTTRIIMERRKEMLEKEVNNPKSKVEDFGIKKRMALLDVLLSATNDGKPLSNADIREEVDTFMFEGHDTTKSAIGFTLYCISRNPEVQQRIYEEIKDVVIGEDSKPELNYRHLTELKYLEKVIRESLRMYPPVSFIGRHITKDCFINGVTLPKNAHVMLDFLALQNDEEYFPEPHRFLPDRPAHENAFAAVPFSAGPRNCIGQRFAMLEMKAFLVRIIQNYELLPIGDPVNLIINVILESKTGWQMGFRKRKEK